MKKTANPCTIHRTGQNKPERLQLPSTVLEPFAKPEYEQRKRKKDKQQIDWNETQLASNIHQIENIGSSEKADILKEILTTHVCDLLGKTIKKMVKDKNKT
ncbi:hypothetical protein RUM43_011313 [Polyplax serrata]|uniref:Uncharacterized protein n=1 Tax=Polyplax serrata TaxID=468196 RepID=A0AAN8NLY6_POLSC